jgi:mRNA-degrading endonuclease RelE of RelBE toxin-antitoxin system
LKLEFLETSVFTRQITQLLSDSEYSALQGALVVSPEAGDLIPGTGGLRKLRWLEPKRGKGKRGGVRVIYYWYEPHAVVYLLLAYSKGERDDLSAREKRILKQLVSEEFK